MSLWDDISDMASGAIDQAKSDVQIAAKDWFVQTAKRNLPVPTGQPVSVPSVSPVPAPIQAQLNQSASSVSNFLNQNMMLVAIAAIGIVAFFIFGRGK